MQKKKSSVVIKWIYFADAKEIIFKWSILNQTPSDFNEQPHHASKSSSIDFKCGQMSNRKYKFERRKW
jgi:hypothetical protein